MALNVDVESDAEALALRYDVVMKKRRITLNLDEDVVEALEAMGGRSLSSAANDALAEVVALHAHREAMARWLDELDELYGTATPEEAAEIEQFLDAVESGDGTHSSSGPQPVNRRPEGAA